MSVEAMVERVLELVQEDEVLHAALVDYIVASAEAQRALAVYRERRAGKQVNPNKLVT